jgi:uncharacterized membrane protein
MKYAVILLFAFSLLFIACDDKKEGEQQNQDTPATGQGEIEQAGETAAQTNDSPDSETELQPVEVHLDFFTDGDLMQLKAKYTNDMVTLFMIEDILKLPRVPSEAGIKYANDNASFWSDGDEAVLSMGDANFELVKDKNKKVWYDAMENGVDFRAVGQEPGWTLEIDDDGYTIFKTQFEEVYWEVETVESRIDSQTDNIIYPFHVEESKMDIIIAEEECFDSMSGESYPYSVQVKLKDKTFYGCGIDF